MSFTGDLEHLPIVDIVQLLHAARKSGALLVRGKAESQLVFREGRVVSAEHRASGARLRRVLLESKLLDEEVLAEARAEIGRGAGLLAGLLGRGLLDGEQAQTMLERLVQINLVEMLSWERGSFSLDVDAVPIADEFRLLAEATGEPVVIDTQGLLMEALRVYDEKVRDGALPEELFATEEEEEQEAAGTPLEAGAVLSLEDLGLDGLDQLERKIPDVFTSLHDPTPVDPRLLHLQTLATELDPEGVDELWNALTALGEPPAAAATAARGRTLIFYGGDALLSHCLATVCKGRGVALFTTNDGGDVEPILDQSLGKGLRPLLILDDAGDAEGDFSPERLAQLRRRLRASHPGLPIVQWQARAELAPSLQAYRDGVLGVFPRPARGAASFVPDLLLLLEALLTFVQEGADTAAGEHLAHWQSSVRELAHLTEVPDIAEVLLRFVGNFCPRALVLVAAPPGLVAGPSLGLEDAADGTTPPLRLRIPLDETSSLRQVLEEGRMVLASHGDEVLRQHLHPLIGAPAAPTALLLPLVCRGKKIALIYGDFGQRPPALVPLELLEVLAGQAALQIEVNLYRKRLEK